MGTEFDKGFFLFNKNWFYENKFFNSLTHAEFRIMIYLLSSILRPRKNSPKYKDYQWIVDLYHSNGILFVNASQRTIAQMCAVHRGTVITALNKFEDMGAVIIIRYDDNTPSNVYVVGFQYWDHEMKEYYLVDSIPVSSGKNLPEEYKNYIRKGCGNKLFGKSDTFWGDLFGIKPKHEVEVVAE